MTREQNLERYRIYRERNHEKILERKRIYRERNREKIRAADRLYYAKNKWKWVVRRAIKNVRMAKDETYYAAVRARQRAYGRKHHDQTRQKEYMPRLSWRFPDWCTMGASVLDATSQFLAVNLTPSQRVYVRELFIERNNWRTK